MEAKTLAQKCALTDEQKALVEIAELALMDVYNSGVKICAFFDDYRGLSLKCVNSKEVKPDFDESFTCGDNPEEYVYRCDLQDFGSALYLCADEDWLKIATEDGIECEPF